MTLNPKRIRKLNKAEFQDGPIVYWMTRDQRLHCNWSLLFAAQIAKERNVPFCIVFCLVTDFPGGTLRSYDFMLRGLEELEQEAKTYNIPFYLLEGEAQKVLPSLLKKIHAGAVISDFSPMKVALAWKKHVMKKITIPMFEVDSHNIVPCWVVSQKQEFAARTIRPKIHRLLPEFLTPFPKVPKQERHDLDNQTLSWKTIRTKLKTDSSVSPVDWIQPGEKEAKKGVKLFLQKKLKGYDERRNHPELDGISNLSPYLHFGQISAQQIANEVVASSTPEKDKEAFLEELIVRRELSDNYCYYNKNYDNPNGYADWAKKTLEDHKKDRREYLYSKKQFEEAKTHDPLWNAAQTEMVKKGKMHGYMRMYWAKKLLEWTKSPEQAHKIGLYLNDKYELDGRDPNGYVGIAWSIGGVHDRPWFERDIFGKIRYMNANGCKRKFDVEEYIRKINAL